MIEKAENKIIEKKDTKIKSIKKDLKDYFYPDHSLTIKATSREEADLKLLEIIKK